MFEYNQQAPQEILKQVQDDDENKGTRHAELVSASPGKTCWLYLKMFEYNQQARQEILKQIQDDDAVEVCDATMMRREQKPTT